MPVSWVNIRHNHNVRSLIRPENRLLTEIATIAIVNVNNDNYLFYVCVEEIREKSGAIVNFVDYLFSSRNNIVINNPQEVSYSYGTNYQHQHVSDDE